MKDKTSPVGSRIKSARKDIGLSQRELAERVPRLSRTALGQIESGRREVASHELFGIAEALGTTTGELLGMSEISYSSVVRARLSGVVSRQVVADDITELCGNKRQEVKEVGL